MRMQPILVGTCVSAVMLCAALTKALAQTAAADPTTAPARSARADALQDAVTLHAADATAQIMACDALRARGHEAAAAGPMLTSLLRSEDAVRFHAAQALVAIGPAALPAARSAVLTVDADARRAAANVVAEIESAAGVKDATWIAQLDAEPAIDRLTAAVALGRFATPGDGVIQALARARNDLALPVSDAAEEGLRILDARSAVAAMLAGQVPPPRMVIEPANRVATDASARRLRQLMERVQATHVDPAPAGDALVEIGFYAPPDKAVLAAASDIVNDHPQRAVRDVAAITLWQFGSAGVRELLHVLRTGDADARRAAADAIGPDVPTDGDVTRLRTEVLDALASAIDSREPRAARAAADALLRFGADSSTQVSRVLERASERAKGTLAEALADLPPDRLDAVAEALSPGVNAAAPATPPHGIRLPPGDRLAQLDNVSLRLVEDAEMPALLNALKSGGDEQRQHAAHRLFNAVPEQFPKEAKATLAAATDDALAGVREDATRLLAALPDTTAELVTAAGSSDPIVRDIAAAGLARRPDSMRSAKAVTILCGRLNSRDATLRRAALKWAAGLDPGNAEPIPNLVALLKDGGVDGVDRTLAATLLGRFTADDKAAVPALIGALADPSPEMRTAAVTSLRAYGPVAASAVGPLGRFLNEPNAALHDAAAATLAELGPEGRHAATVFYDRELRDAREPAERRAAVHRLAQLGPEAAAAAPQLVGLLADGDNVLRNEVASALAAIGAPARTSGAVPALTRMIDNRDPDVREAATSALVALAPDGAGLAPALVNAVLNHDRRCADRLAAALRPAADGVRDPLLKRLSALAGDDPDVAVRAAAVRAVEALGMTGSANPSTRPAAG